VADHWLEHFRHRGATPEKLDTATRERMLELLAPDFDLVSTLRARVRGIHDDLVRLTEEQSQFLAGFEDEPRLILRGGAGSGKTMLALAETERLACDGGSVLLFCASGRLASELTKALGGAEHVRVESAIELAAKTVAEAGVGDQIPDAASADVLAIHLPELAAHNLPSSQAQAWDALVVDEAQDLMSPNWSRYFDRLLRGGLEKGRWRYFLDPNQDVLLGSDPASVEHIDRQATSHYRLKKNCRNTRQVATSAALFTGLESLDTLRVEGPDVEEHWYRDASGGRATAVSVIREWLTGGLTPDQIAILSRRPLRESILAGAREEEIGVPLVDAMTADSDDPRAIRFWSIFDFKGLEADAVLVADIDDLGPGRRRLELYLAVTRARALLCLMLHHGVEDQYSARTADFGKKMRLGLLGSR
jgi:hypothetical protein